MDDSGTRTRDSLVHHANRCATEVLKIGRDIVSKYIVSIDDYFFINNNFLSLKIIG